MRARPTPSANTFHAVDVRNLLRYLITLYCKFTVTSWLNDCEEMKLVNILFQLTLFCFINTRVYYMLRNINKMQARTTNILNKLPFAFVLFQFNNYFLALETDTDIINLVIARIKIRFVATRNFLKTPRPTSECYFSVAPLLLNSLLFVNENLSQITFLINIAKVLKLYNLDFFSTFLWGKRG